MRSRSSLSRPMAETHWTQGGERLQATRTAGGGWHCPLCGSRLRLHYESDGATRSAACTGCTFVADEAHPHGVTFHNPWQRSSPETVSCRYCHADKGERFVHAPECPYAVSASPQEEK